MINMMVDAYLWQHARTWEQALFAVLFIGGGSALIYNVLKVFNVMEVRQ